MKFQLIPLNEGQEMNCVLTRTYTLSDAKSEAYCIAKTLQATLRGATISCLVNKLPLQSDPGWVVRHDGRVLRNGTLLGMVP